jgi:hypothetical protein
LRFAKLVAQHEREAGAKDCESINSIEDFYGERPELICAKAIRARGDSMIEAKEIHGELWIKASDHHQSVKKAIEHEREACARLCQAEADDGTEGPWDGCCLFLANKIRAR